MKKNTSKTGKAFYLTPIANETRSDVHVEQAITSWIQLEEKTTILLIDNEIT